MAAMNFSGLRTAANWMGWALAYMAATVAAGAVLGALLSPLLGPLFRIHLTAGEALRRGLLLGAEWGGVWSVGVALVMCLRRAYRDQAEPAPRV
jgi:hypothetical protein